jgi:formylglycine-generating enzyme required for sulfatase activity
MKPVALARRVRFSVTLGVVVAVYFSPVGHAEQPQDVGDPHCVGAAPSRHFLRNVATDAKATSSAETVASPSGEPEGMVWIPGGTFWMGSAEPMFPDARPIHQVYVDGFWMDRTTVTNEQFAAFVKATGYVTAAERRVDPAEYPGAPAEMLEPGAPVFTPPSKPVPLNDLRNWWRWQPGASWNHPEGPSSSIDGREQHPVVQIAYEDALAYAKWVGKRLPTEAEWEFAARGGQDRKTFVWGDQDMPDDKPMANIFQGHFPDVNSAKDGFEGTAPVCSFPVNGYGLCDMSGNVWQWTSDWYRPDYYQMLAAQHDVVRNPRGPADSYDPSDPGVAKRVQKGGSFLCSDQYCMRYRPGGRGKGEAAIGASNVGFRVVLSPADQASRKESSDAAR